MKPPTTHVHISEREPDGSFEDCTWDSGLEFYRDAFDATRPHTHTEAQLLRKASGEPPTGGSNLSDFRKGVKERYNHSLPPAIAAKAILAALKPGHCAVVQGSMSAFGPGHPLSKWDRNFNGGHAVYIARQPNGVLLWCDPEAPTQADVPVVVTEAEVQKFVDAFAGQAIVAPATSWPASPPEEIEMPTLTTYIPGFTANIKPESNVRDAPEIKGKLLRHTAVKEPIALTGTVKGDVDPANGSNIWYTWWKNNRWEYTAKDNVIDIKAPGGVVTDCTDEVAKAVATQKAADQVAKDAAVAQATLAATDAEQARIKKVLGLK